MLAFFLIAIALSTPTFEKWIHANHKVYANKAEYLYRLAVFLDNAKFVAANPNTELNVFADLTHEEFIKSHLGASYEVPEVATIKQEVKSVPESVDWRSIMNPAKDQAHCGGCWAFCTAATMEGRVNKDLGTLYSFSEQQLISCDPTDNKCKGGHPSNAFAFIKSNNGITLEETYPYIADNGTCKTGVRNIATVTGAKRVTDGSEPGLQDLTATYGPIAVGMDASRVSFQLYKKGTIYNDEKCKRFVMDHCVTVVGYGKNDDGEYWIIRNSWGESWGDKGHFLLARNQNNRCGIGRDSNLPEAVKLV
ncbi:cysteine proteinase ACP1 precursor, putative [Entamoeba invadens IP1]|uniref:Cysteine proteinase ACP1, putative n=1 Tax=Entamoeba invadens IP1 TaxID=370355 RepID=L7FJP4_ENTIV|nr:cysteine proteinase ACP1 precursor, putative [Entamoeba invadens IP1]ELP83636.1 cysteine proteinase ACP1 precursor, putative [Entamoeba invadens IP1]|eukprot:XP_004182982.1 cysteine proteinase ACP1 precursor, putative [Entamoeba invadens IP1]